MKERIATLFHSASETPLFYIESGSRLWGIASPDSDFDVRGFHLQSKRQYFDFKRHRDLIEVMDGDFDFVSYDVNKMFGLLAHSNPTVLEWIRAHIVYFNVLPEWNRFRDELIAHVDFKALFHHYLSLAGGHITRMQQEKEFTYKKVFYCIRGLLSAELAAAHVLPELLIDHLLAQFEVENDVIHIAQTSLEKKRSHQEKKAVPLAEQKQILPLIERFAAQVESKAPPPGGQRQHLERILSDYSFMLKNRFYSE